MFEGLLKYSLDRISSLEHYYEIEGKNVKEISKEGKKEHSIGAMIDNYFSLLTSCEEEKRTTQEFLELKEKVKEYIDIDGVKVTKDADTSSVVFRFQSEEIGKKIGNIKEEKSLYSQYADMPFIHGSTSLMMLVTRFEEFISNYLSEIYIHFPQKYLDDKKLTFSEIASANIDQIKRNLVLREVDAKMRESYKEWFKIYKAHGMSSDTFENDLNRLEEIYARRNILVHNSGIVNTSYLNSVSSTKAKRGDILPVNKSYMKEAFNTIYRIILLMLIDSSKLNKETEPEYLEDIFHILFDLLKKEQYQVCELAYSAIYKKNSADTETKLMSQVNKWICIIAQRGFEEVEEEIENFDVSALNTNFKLAKTVLLNKYEETDSILDSLLKRDDIPASIIEDWPLFMWYRMSENYTILRKKYPEKFNVESTEVDPPECETREQHECSEQNKSELAAES